MSPHVPIADRLQGLTELSQVDFHSACQKAVGLLCPWPLSQCQIDYFDHDHSRQTLARSSQGSGSSLCKLGEFAAGKGKLLGRLGPVAKENPHAAVLIDAVCRQLTSSWSRYQLSRRLIAAKQATHTSEKLREWQSSLSDIVQQAEDIRTVYQHVHASLHSLIYARNMIVAIMDQHRQQVRFIYTRDSSLGDSFLEGETLPLEALKNSLISKVLQRDSALLLSNRALRRLDAGGHSLRRGQLPGSWLGVPFAIDDNKRGVVILQTYGQEPAYQEADKDLLVTASRFISVAHQRYQDKQQLEQQAHYDSLTGLANRKQFISRLEQQLERQSQASVLFIDLDDFKQLNDRFGHSQGDFFLSTQASRLEELLLPGELASRIGGDEFAVMLPGHETERSQQLAAEICQVLSLPIQHQQQTIQGNVSIGIADYQNLPLTQEPQQSTAVTSRLCHRQCHRAAERLLNQADQAMYCAKRHSGSTWQQFDSQLQHQLERRKRLQSALEQAIESQQLTLHYQPIYTSDGHQLCAFECLLRWHHPALGDIPPQEFIPLAEDSGQILAIDHWVLEQAARQLSRWHQQGRNIRLTVNVSSRHFRDPLFASRMQRLFNEYQLPRQGLVIELTEHALLSHMETARRVIRQLSTIGVRLALDDFGTGFSSLSYLNNLPFDLLKIDRSFVSGLPDQTNAGRIVSTIVSLAKAMGMITVAEGVETTEQQDCLSNMGCDRLQGYHLGRPMPLHEAETLIARLAA